jgi:hypothetical protein
MSSHIVENSRIRAGRTEDKLEWPLAPTIAPWKIADGTKIFAKRGPVAQYLYGTGYDTSEWRPGWQPAFVTSPESGLIVMDRDADGFEELMARCGIPLSPLFVLTGRDGGIQYYYDGRHLLPGCWPGQRTLYGPDGITAVGDCKSTGFVPVPWSIHPNGRTYRLGPDSARGFEHALPWQPEWAERLDADQEEAGRRRPAGYRQTEGDGRNNFLYELKKKLFYEQGLDQDDPELHRLIYEANQQFDVPLDEGEVEYTILRIKRWKRHGHFNPEPLQMAGPDVSAGSKTFGLKEDVDKATQASRDVRKRSDLRKAGPPKRLATVRRVEAKLKAEQDTHPLSIDWFGAPPGAMELYSDLADLSIESLKAGAEFAQLDASLPCASIDGPWRQQLEWLLHGNGAPLIEYHGGLVYLLSDPVTAELPRYPGVPDWIEPKAGKSLGEKLDHLIVMVRSVPGGEAMTQREEAEVINNAWFRKTFGLEEYRYVSVSAMSQHHVKLRKRGTIRIIAPAVRYREGHIWHLDQSTVYRTGLRFSPDDETCELIRLGIVTALGPDWKRVRAKLTSPFEDAASEIDFGGPESPLDLGELASGPPAF